jgi:hypothetical protein
VNGEIQVSYNGLARYDELADPKYTDATGGIFDIMAITVIQSLRADAPDGLCHSVAAARGSFGTVRRTAGEAG